MRLAAAIVMVLVSGPALAQDCAGLTRHFVLCDAGTDWATGEWEQFGDGATLHLGPLAFDFVEDWAGRHKGEAPDTGAALDALLADVMDGETSVTHLRDRLEGPDLVADRVIQTITFAGDAPILRASMVAEGRGERVLLMLTAPDGFPIEDMDTRSREIAALVRPATED